MAIYCWIRWVWPNQKLSVNTLHRPAVCCLQSLRTDFITAWRNVMTRRTPRGTANQGEARGKTAGSSTVGWEGWWWRRGGEIEQQIQAFSHYHAPFSLSSADSHTASLCCTQLNVHSSKLSLLPGFTLSSSCPADVSRASYWMHMATYAIFSCAVFP